MLGRLLKKYKNDTRGNFAIITAMLGIPLAVGTSIAVDLQNRSSHTNHIQDALDAAALSAVMKGSDLSEAGRRKHAIQVFNENYTGDAVLNVRVESTPEKVSVGVDGKLATSIASVTGLTDINLSG